MINIVYLPQITNLKISDKNPLIYLKDYDCPEFEKIMPNHILPQELLDWSRMNVMPEDALDQFIEKRIDKIISVLKNKITSLNFEVVDTKESTEELDKLEEIITELYGFKIGSKVRWIDKDKITFGRVTRLDPKLKRVYVKYDDDDENWERIINNEKFKLADTTN